MSWQAFSTCTRLLAAATISRARKIGTPERMSVAYVRQKRDSVILWIKSPKDRHPVEEVILEAATSGVVMNFIHNL